MFSRNDAFSLRTRSTKQSNTTNAIKHSIISPFVGVNQFNGRLSRIPLHNPFQKRMSRSFVVPRFSSLQGLQPDHRQHPDVLCEPVHSCPHRPARCSPATFPGDCALERWTPAPVGREPMIGPPHWIGNAAQAAGRARLEFLSSEFNSQSYLSASEDACGQISMQYIP